jgi:hypothetical protein
LVARQLSHREQRAEIRWNGIEAAARHDAHTVLPRELSKSPVQQSNEVQLAATVDVVGALFDAGTYDRLTIVDERPDRREQHPGASRHTLQ